MIKKLLLICSFLFLFSAPTAAQFELEQNYPDFLGAMEEGLPGYITYMFRLSIIVVGLIIFASLIYAGIKYVTAFGDPGKFQDAKKRILASFLGAAILLSAVLVFNLIDPDLTNLNLDQLDPLGTTLTPGLYVCEKGAGGNLNELHVFINAYTIFSKIIIDSIGDESVTYDDRVGYVEAQEMHKNNVLTFGHENNCIRVSTSVAHTGPLRFKITRDKSVMFAIPIIRESTSNDPGDEAIIEFPYGFVLHAEANFSNRCRLINSYKLPGESYVFNVWPDYVSFFIEEREARSITLFEKKEINLDNSVSLYSNVNHADDRFHDNKAVGIDHLGREESLIPLTTLSANSRNLSENLRSIKFNGTDTFVFLTTDLQALTWSATDDQMRHCGIIDKDIFNLSGHPAIGTVCRRTIRVHGTETMFDLQDEEPKEVGNPCVKYLRLIDGVLL